MKSKRWWLALSGGLILILVLSACAPAAAPTPAAPKPGEPGAPPVATPTKGPLAGGYISDLYTSDPPHYDFQLHQAYTIQYIYALISQRVVKIDMGVHRKPNEFVIVPDLAEKWEISPDGKEYTFSLKKGMKWHNKPPVNGREVVAEDIKFNYERYLKLGTKAPMGWLYGDIASIETPDNYTVKFILKAPFAGFLMNLAYQYSWIGAPEIVKAQGDMTKADPVGMGPMLWDGHDRNVSMRFKKNPDFHIKGRPYLDGFQYLFIPDAAAERAAFRAGQLDILSYQALPTKEDLDEVLKTNPNSQYERYPHAAQSGVIVNLRRKPFDDWRVRRALNLTMDRQKMIDTVFRGDAWWAGGPVTPALEEWAFTQEEMKKIYARNVPEAKRLLAEAGYPDGFKTTMASTIGYGAWCADLAQVYRENLKDIGVVAETKMYDYASFVRVKTTTMDFDLLYGYYTPYVDPGQVFEGHYLTGSGRNEAGFSDLKLDEMILRQRTILDKAERKKLIREMQLYTAEKVNTIILDVERFLYLAWHPYVKGYRPHITYGVPILDMWKER